MGLDITFYKAKRSKDNETKERLQEIRKALAAEYLKSDECNSKLIKELEDEKEKINPWNEVAYFRKVNFLIPFFGYEEDCSNIEIDKYQVADGLCFSDKSQLEYMLRINDNNFAILPYFCWNNQNTYILRIAYNKDSYLKSQYCCI